MGKWGKADDAKLKDLLCRGHRRGGINPNDLSKPYIEQIIKNFFPERTYQNFASLYHGKINKWRVNNTVAGGRDKSCIVAILFTPSLLTLLFVFILFKKLRRKRASRKK